MADSLNPWDIYKERRGPLDIRKDRPNEMSVEPSRPNTDMEKLRQTLWDAGYALVPREKIVHIEKSLKYNKEAIANTAVMSFDQMLAIIGVDARRNVLDHTIEFIKITKLENDGGDGTICAKLIVLRQD